MLVTTSKALVACWNAPALTSCERAQLLVCSSGSRGTRYEWLPFGLITLNLVLGAPSRAEGRTQARLECAGLANFIVFLLAFLLLEQLAHAFFVFTFEK